jgi:ribosomal protein L7/L12
VVSVSIGLLALWSALQASQSRMERRLTGIERELTELRAHLGLPRETPAEDERIQALLRAGRKLNAIKLYRERYGVGRREAKEAVDGLAARIGQH